MSIVGIVANGPIDYIPNLKQYKDKINIWIGADRGSLHLLKNDININYAVGDFDSIDEQQKKLIKQNTVSINEFPSEKNETDLEIAIEKAIELKPEKIYLFGVTGGRLDHTIINMQLLHTIVKAKIRGIIVDKWNILELTNNGKHTIVKNDYYPYISFIPYTEHVSNITLKGFYYPLKNFHISQGSTRCISNKLNEAKGTLSYKKGMLLVIQSRDAN